MGIVLIIVDVLLAWSSICLLGTWDAILEAFSIIIMSMFYLAFCILLDIA